MGKMLTTLHAEDKDAFTAAYDELRQAEGDVARPMFRLVNVLVAQLVTEVSNAVTSDAETAETTLRSALGEISEWTSTGATMHERRTMANTSAFALMEHALNQETNSSDVEPYAFTREALTDLCLVLIQHAAGAMSRAEDGDRAATVRAIHAIRDRFLNGDDMDAP